MGSAKELKFLAELLLIEPIIFHPIYATVLVDALGPCCLPCFQCMMRKQSCLLEGSCHSTLLCRGVAVTRGMSAAQEVRGAR